jgi:hypothetical protein
MTGILTAAVYILAIKTITGFRFSWEICPCCGKRYAEHKSIPTPTNGTKGGEER